MATINLNILVKSVNTSSNVLSLYGQDILTVEEPLEDTSKASVDTVSPLTIVSNTAAKDAYVYIKNTDATMVTNLRHFEQLKLTLETLETVRQGIQNNLTNDFLAQDLRHALYHLGQITGSITNDDLLKNICGKFCIGK